jgi:hypothetical protein
MHNSDAEEIQTAAVRLYLDESGTSDPGTPTAVVGGMIINRSHYDHFEPTWFDILKRHDVNPPVHMKEFGPNGKLGWLCVKQRRELFAELVTLINSHKIFSISATLSNSEYEENCPPELREELGVYGMCFNLAAMISHKLADGKYEGKIPFILDTGNRYANHVRSAHAAMLELQKEVFLHAGGLYFDDDTYFGVLQAADVIAWGVRRQESKKSYPPGLEQIGELLLKEQAHHNNEWKVEWLAELGNWARVTLMQRRESEESDAEEF